MSKDENKKKKDVKNNSRFLKESKAELKKVSWPKPKALANDTATVIGIVLIVAIIVFILDALFLTLNEKLIIKTEEKIVNTTTVDEIVNPIEGLDLNTIQEETESEDTTSEQNTENDESQETTENSEAE